MQNYRGRGRISIPYLLTIGIAVLLTVVLAARQVTRSTSIRIVAARGAIRNGDKIDASRLGFATVPKSAVPPGAILDPAAIIGRVLQRPVAEGKAITTADFVPSGPVMWLADAPPEGRVVITVSVPGTLLPVQQLRAGDQMEVLAVTTQGHSHVIARDAYLLGSIMGKQAPPRNNTLESITGRGEQHASVSVVGLVLAVRPQDASPIAAAQGVGERLTFVLHGSREIQSGRLLDVTPVSHASHDAAPKTPDQVELISGSKREKVNLN
ncbi:MAG: hypothetical protein JO093_24525 [Acidobacteria bacterium]|nr:hypothetical protein [Acidobacteriota bacterium]MBV9071857.1 hypothetical protein [Acidobacteriota bacterium]MBV9188795.1 hypothetical protein [Acidobacteriota bacterium]